MEPMPKIAISSDFMKAFSAIPQAQQKKVREFMLKFEQDPTQASINYEPIHEVKDEKVRTVRIDLKYRAIVLHPSNGDLYLLCWIDNHDEAVRWAKNKTFEINEHTGAIQIINTNYSAGSMPSLDLRAEKGSGDKIFFSDFKERELLRLGVPKPLVPSMYAINNEEELIAMKKHLPDEAFEAMMLIHEGFTYEDVVNDIERIKHENIDVEDYEKALEHPDSMRRFKVINTTAELRNIIQAPLEQWRIYLHPIQRELVTLKSNGPIQVLGGAGTGKTVVALHRASHLVKEVFNYPEDKILILTYTKNLAEVLKTQLNQLIDSNIRHRVEVSTVHGWAYRLLTDHHINFNIASSANKSIMDGAWNTAYIQNELDLDLLFYQEEWEEVVQRVGIDSETAYLIVPRIGRGTSLSRLNRKKVWKVLKKYKDIVASHGIREWVDIVRDARQLLETRNVSLPYKSVIIDESQDLHAEDFKLIRKILPESKNDLFIVGDPHQRIYKNKVVLSHCGINIKGNRSKRLTINYRTTEQIRKWAVTIIRDDIFDDLNGGIDDQIGYMSLLDGAEPEWKHFPSKKEELHFLRRFINNAILLGVELSNICLVTRNNSSINDVYIPSLVEDNIPYVKLNNNSNIKDEGIRLGTIHSVKGLEFSHMIVAGVNEDIVPPAKAIERAADEISKRDIILREKSLLYVAATRARDYLLITSYNNPSSILVNSKFVTQSS
jgi:superfamily I DNA/RNA helicase